MMRYVQFRVHPSVGVARMGNSDNAYYLASEFPSFMQEEFPTLRLAPKPRRHPKSFFGADDSALSAHGNLVDYPGIYDPRSSVQNRFTEEPGLIFPQAARFRVFAYVYAEVDAMHPVRVFEVTSEIADIEWKVNIANKKSKITMPFPEEPAPNMVDTPWVLDTASDALVCKRILPRLSLPNLGYIFLEPDENNRSRVTGRLHVIGNEGDLVGNANDNPLRELWTDNWFDSAGDGSVEAVIRPGGNGNVFRDRVGISSADEMTYLEYGVDAPRSSATSAVRASPGWVVVGCPDYVPDMPHIVSLWDLALDRGVHNLDSRRARVQSGKHNQIVLKRQVDSYLRLDYLINIHTQLCLFEDVRQVSALAYGDDTDSYRGHNNYPSETPPVIAPTDTEGTVLKKKVQYGQILLYARDRKADLADFTKLKDPDSRKPINEWMKRAIYQRLRKPGSLYDDKGRKFIINPEGNGNQFLPGIFPRKLGRRLDYDRSIGIDSDKGRFYAMMQYRYPPGNLRKFHGLPFTGHYCGKDKSPIQETPPGSSLTDDEIVLMKYLDDMYWPATFGDMPMVRELTYTYVQYDQFGAWQGADVAPLPGQLEDHAIRTENIFDQIVSPALRATFTVNNDADANFSAFLAARPKLAPAMIDMAHLGSMIGGSFLPGIEVGREAGIAANWSLYHGGTVHFPDIRFKRCDIEREHTLGTLTKDLAVPWTRDFRSCDESYWPTARPGKVFKTLGTRGAWMPQPGPSVAAPGEVIDEADIIPHLHRRADGEEYYREYWKSLGFVRRRADDRFVVTE